MNPKKSLNLLRTAWEVARFERREKRQVNSRFYQDPVLKSADLALLHKYRFRNPYSMSRRFWGEPNYGETPLTSLETIGLKVKLKPSDTFVDLGAGRGRGVFFIHHRFGCHTIGVEKVPSFITKAQSTKRKNSIESVDFLEADLLSLPPIYGTVFYLAWTCFDEELMERVTKWLEKQPKAKVITISEPLQSAHFSVVESFTVPFVWGEGEVFIHESL